MRRADDAASMLAGLVDQAREAPGLGALTHLQDGTTLGIELNRGLTFFFIDDVELTPVKHWQGPRGWMTTRCVSRKGSEASQGWGSGSSRKLGKCTHYTFFRAASGPHSKKLRSRKGAKTGLLGKRNGVCRLPCCQD